MEIKRNWLTASSFLQLYRSVGWEAPGMDQVERALAHTLVTFTALEDQRPVGMVRLLGDGGMSFYLKDFAVLPTHQGKGIGSLLLQSAEEYIRESLPAGWAVSLELISTPEAVAFYKSNGFEERPCAWDGPGMFKMLR